MFSAFKKAIFTITFLSLTVSPVLAQTQQPNSTQPKPIKSNNYFAPEQTNYSVQNISHGILCELGGASVYPCVGLQKKPGKVGKLSFVPYLFDRVPDGGAIGQAQSVMLAMVDTPPASTAEYIASLKEDIGIVKPAYAAAAPPTPNVPGSGAGVIAPILNLWKVARNIAYLAFIIIFIIVGFMVMMRQRINPQTVISVQAALPGLVFGLILVTLSYFIAALIIDLSFVAIQIIAYLFITAGFSSSLGTSIYDPISSANNSSLVSLYTSSAFNLNTFVGVVTSIFQIILGGIFGSSSGSGTWTVATGAAGSGGILAGLLAATPIGWLLTVGALVAAPAIGGLLLFVILVVAVFVQFLRLLWKLVQAYISLLVSTILGPLIITYGSIPGRNGAITNWAKGLLANSLIFPAVFGAFMFAGIILGSLDNSTLWQSPPPLFGNMKLGIIQLILGLGIILAMPAVPDVVKKAFNVQGITDSLGPAALAGAAAGYGFAKWGGSKAANLTGIPTYLKYKSQERADRITDKIGKGWRQRIASRIENVAPILFPREPRVPPPS